MKNLSFSTVRASIDVTIDEEKYVLLEASGATGVDYTNSLVSGITYGENGKPQKLNGQASVQILLVGECLYKINPDTGKTFKTSVGQKWVRDTLSSRILKELFEAAKELSNIDETETAESIQKQIDTLQEKLDKKQNESDVGESSEVSEAGSD